MDAAEHFLFRYKMMEIRARVQDILDFHPNSLQVKNEMAMEFRQIL